ncbi:YlmH family RNA-binding protein [Bacillus sp. FJAT-45350]|uniref:YlmH family RNA-binding protein n=1 Tax=Bacillus sp. FJAT-45350 TaxID=2011014 RepID=UPI000BB6C361|nr:RNA-binding protein [Bacillus sp. FJAT-45350]
MSIYQHFRVDEHPFIDQVLEWKGEVSLAYQMKLTDFLDPRQQQIISSIIGNDDEVRLSSWGGTPYSERKRILLYPSFFELNDDDFQVCTFNVDYPRKFVTIEHREVLGSLMSLGMKREKFGDILLHNDTIHIVLASEIADYVQLNLESIGRAKIKLNRIPNSEQIKYIDEWEEQGITVSSLRLDLVLSEIYKTSRSKILPYIEKGVTKVNWKTIEQPSFQVEEQDHFSVRGFGRSKLISVDGKTKKDKWRLIIGRKK